MKNPIFDIDNWREISATLARNKTRTFLTAFGIFWGTAMLSLLIGGADGLKGLLMRNFQGFATNMAAVFPNRTTISYKGFNKGMTWEFNDDDLHTIRALATDIDASSAIMTYPVNLVYGTKTKAPYATGVEPDYFKICVPVIFEGREFNNSDYFSHSKVIMIGRNLANELFGDESPLGKFISVSGSFFQVIGVVGQKSEASIGNKLDDSVVIPLTTMRRVFNLGSNSGFFVYTTKRGINPGDLKPKIMRAIRANHPIHPDDDNAIGIENIAEAFEMIDKLFLGVTLLAIVVGAGTLIAGIIGVGNIMWIIVKERTQEIGIRRAIGAKPRDIIVQILCEGMVLTTLAGTLGVCFASLVLWVVDHATTDPVKGSAHFLLPFSTAMAIMATFLILGTLAGLIPSLKAMSIKPIEAMRDK